MLRKTFPRRDLSRLCPPIWSSTCGSVAWTILGSSLGAEVDLDLQGCVGCVQYCAAQSHDSIPTIRVPLQHHAVHQQHLRAWAGYPSTSAIPASITKGVNGSAFPLKFDLLNMYAIVDTIETNILSGFVVLNPTDGRREIHHRRWCLIRLCCHCTREPTTLKDTVQ